MFSINSTIGLFAHVDLSALPEEKTALFIEGLVLHYGNHQALLDIHMRIANGQV
ncbi:phosphate ABC transporter ATP-binding protein, partial [Photobacterium ganghwense]